MRLERLTILSRKTERARQIDLSPTTTLILGGNDTGKSSIIKSIYETLGASVKPTASWDQLDTISAVDFTHDGSNFTIVFHRKPRWYLVHAHETEERHLFTSVTHGLGPFLAKLFGFRLRLAGRDGVMVVPPPAFQLLPFYIDQDLGWRESWASFEQLGQFKNWKRDLIDYFVGKKPPEYFDLKSSYVEKSEQARDQGQHLKNVRSVLSNIREDYSGPRKLDNPLRLGCNRNRRFFEWHNDGQNGTKRQNSRLRWKHTKPIAA